MSLFSATVLPHQRVHGGFCDRPMCSRKGGRVRDTFLMQGEVLIQLMLSHKTALAADLEGFFVYSFVPSAGVALESNL